jgi:hypothetical protein
LYISNHKTNDSGKAVVRLRFESKVWDLTLHPGAETVVDLFKARNEGVYLSALKLTLLNGDAGIALEKEKYPDLSVPGWGQFHWDSLNPASYNRAQISKQDLNFARTTLFPKYPVADSANARGMTRALKAIKDRMTQDKAPLIALREVLERPGGENPYEHQLAIYCLGSMDEIKELMNILGRADDLNSPDRMFVIVAMRRWLDRGRDQDRKLYDPDPKIQNGLLVSDVGYTRSEAERIMSLLRDPTPDQIFNSSDYYEDLARDLASEKVSIAELARWRLALLAIDFFRLDLPKLKSFRAARPRAERVAVMQEVLDKVHEGRLPPPEPGKPRQGGGGRPTPKGGTGATPDSRQNK